jgi:hypothetical protein
MVTMKRAAGGSRNQLYSLGRQPAQTATEDVVVKLPKHPMGDDKFPQSRNKAYEKHLAPAASILSCYRDFEFCCVRNQVVRNFIPRPPRDTLTEPYVDACDQGRDLGRKPSTLPSAFGDSIFDRTAQRKQPGKLILQRTNHPPGRKQTRVFDSDMARKLLNSMIRAGR